MMQLISAEELRRAVQKITQGRTVKRTVLVYLENGQWHIAVMDDKANIDALTIGRGFILVGTYSDISQALLRREVARAIASQTEVKNER